LFEQLVVPEVEHGIETVVADSHYSKQDIDT